jgi:cell division protein ZapA
MNQLEVQIMGQSYLLGCPVGGEARLRDAVDKVDGAMCRIRDAGKVKARDRIAVLAALNLAFDLADRAATTTAGPAAEATAPPEHLTQDHAPEDSQTQERLRQLMLRIDQVLGNDGQLI